ncbi:MAG: sulfatase-like hydrolase/transferase, partial [Muribaculaceae bacterium]
YAIGKWHQGHLPKYHPNRRGFDDFYGFLEGSRSYFFKEKTYDAPNSTYKMEHNGHQVVFNDYLTYNLGNAASNFIVNNGKNPFMMYLAFNAVHTPMEATTEDLARFAGHSRQKLAAMTYAVDKAIGQVIQALKKSGKYDNTIIFFLSDNGGAHDNQSSNYPLKGIKGTKFEGGIRVPYFITYPNKLLNGTTYNGLCSSLDIFATSAAVAGINTKQLKRPLDGVNLLPYLTRNNKGEPHDVLYWRKDDMSAVLSGNWKYIRVKGIGERLYNLKNDLVESVDCINNQPLLTKKLKQKLNKWETQLVNPPLWNEGTWIDVTKQMHKELMNNHRITEFTPKK